tara:strand:+ start:1651 stop:1863 length:213 start_codon:yes stop_codon:yes gene_type:complete
MTKFAKFPEWKKTGNIKKANKICNEMYSPEYVGVLPHVRDKIVALKASDNGRCWWIYEFLMEHPFRMEQS